MSRLIAGRFETQIAAEAAAAALADAGFDRSEYGSFYLTPPGQHAGQPGGGDVHHDEGAKHAGGTAAVGGILGGAAGLAAGGIAAAAGQPALIPAAVIAGAGVGAYAGSLQGALKGTRGGDPSQATPEEPVERPSGIMLVACVDRDGMSEAAIEVLRREGALDIEEADGEWRDGMWLDFDPVRTPRLIDAAHERS